MGDRNYIPKIKKKAYRITNFSNFRILPAINNIKILTTYLIILIIYSLILPEVGSHKK